jgi:hypothetical protein
MEGGLDRVVYHRDNAGSFRTAVETDDSAAPILTSRSLVMSISRMKFLCGRWYVIGSRLSSPEERMLKNNVPLDR